jgi:hypothetical protein
MRRRRTAAILACTAFGVTLVVASLAPVEAQQRPAVLPGTSSATANVIRVAPAVGGTALTFGLGAALSQLTNAVASGQSQTLDLGLLGAAFTGDLCQPALLRKDQLPQPTVADNRKGASDVHHQVVPLGPVAVGDEHVTTSTNPSAKAVTRLASADLTPLLDLGGGQSTALSEVVDGKTRRAEADVSIDLDLGGLVQLTGLHWHATHETGGKHTSTGTFTLAELTVLGLPIPIPTPAAAIDSANRLLAVVGVHISLPTVEKVTVPTDGIRVSPLRIAIGGPSPLAALLSPVLDLTRQLRELVEDQLSASCFTSSASILAEIALGVLNGNGSITVDLGGVQAGTADLTLEDPFGAIPPQQDAPPAAAPLPLDAGPLPVISSGPVASAPPVPAGATGPTSAICRSLSPADSPRCSRGSATLLGGLALLGTVAVGCFDGLHRRRRRGRAQPPSAGAA